MRWIPVEIVEFLGRPTVRDNVRSKLAEGSYFMAGTMLLMMGMMTFLAPVLAIADGGSIGEALATVCCGNLFLISTFIPIFLLLWIVGFLGAAFTRDSTWDRDRDLVIRLDDRYLTVDQEYISFLNLRRVNRIPLSLIERVSLDVEPYLRDKGIRIPWWYKPICQSAPSERKYPSLLYGNMGRANMPFDHLVRIDLSTAYPIIARKRHHPDYPEYENMLRTVIITIRPKDQPRFMEEVRSRSRTAWGKGTSGRVAKPPGA
jgi:hypothetical protein